MKLDVLLTDGNYKNTYAILRALKKEGLKVGVLIHKYLSITNFSRLVDKRFIIKSQLVKNPNLAEFSIFWQELESLLKHNEISVFMPVGNISYKFAALYKKKIEVYCKVPVVEKEKMEIAQDKSKTFDLASQIGVPIPSTLRFASNADFFAKLNEVQYPCVLKRTNYDESGVIYCNNEQELIDAFTKASRSVSKGGSLPIVQEYVTGIGTGYYAIYDCGKCVGSFVHERIHEYPITGGASTLAKSVYVHDLKELGDKLLSSLKWHGVAMVEFKRDSYSGHLKLMEVNPKFWGSFELSYVSGINFAHLAYLVALKKEIPLSSYKNNVYFRWTVPHDVLWYKCASTRQRTEFKKVKKDVKIHSNIHWDDPIPVLFNLLFTLYKLIKEQKYRHGHIK